MAYTYTKDDIVEYYEGREISYRVVWDLGHSYAMHYGYWDRSTRTLRQALRRENEVLAEIVGINAADKVLDAGCGIGGSSIFLAKTFGCDVTGITLSEKHVLKARQLAADHLVDGLVQFAHSDFTCTPFADNSFNVVWAIESVCHADDKQEFLKESFRLLAPKGRLIVADGFANKDVYNPHDKLIMNSWLNGWAVNSITTPHNFTQMAKEVGFVNCNFIDTTHNILPSARRLFLISFPAMIYGRLQKFFNLITMQELMHSITLYNQYIALKKRLWYYGIFTAEKPG